jgi:hypothetical protein
MPVRRSRLNYQSVGGTFASTRLGRPVHYDSLIERDFFLILDLHPAVAWYEEQPIRIPWIDGAGTERIYIPDVLIRFRNGVFLNRKVRQPSLVELKHGDDLGKNWASLRPKLRAGFRKAREQGWIFHLFTDKQVRGCALRNAEFVRKHLHGDCAEEIVAAIKKQVREQRECTAERLAAALGKEGRAQRMILEVIWTLVAKGVLSTDLEVPISPNSPIFPGWNYGYKR